MKKLFNQITLVFMLLFLLQACKKNNTDVQVEEPKDVYVAGYEVNSNFIDGQATYWKNGEKTNLPTVSSSIANSIFVTDDAVYVAGRDGEGIVYWKNGAKVKLTGEVEARNARGIFVSGQDVYVSGAIRESTPSTSSRACYWKNGSKQYLGESGKLSEAQAIVVNRNDVYVTGIQYGAGGFSGYWKNGVPVNLNTNHYEAYITSIFIAGNDIYLSGFITENNNNKAAYWKNNILVSLHDVSLNGDTYANSIHVDNGVVYTAGREDNETTGNTLPVYWANGVKKYLPLPAGLREEAKSIFVSGNDIYVAGGGDMSPVIWKNGVRTELPHTDISDAISVFIK